MLRHVLLICMCIGLALCKYGSCPPTLSIEVCDATCGPQKPCEKSQLCCPTACDGSLCVDPMTERHFVNYVKKGSCPEHPGGPWMCSHTCTSDSDCSRALKCCRNRCGVRTCQQPRLQETTTSRWLNNNPT